MSITKILDLASKAVSLIFRTTYMAPTGKLEYRISPKWQITAVREQLVRLNLLR